MFKIIYALVVALCLCVNVIAKDEAYYNNSNPIPMELLESWESIDEVIIWFKRYGLFYCIKNFDSKTKENKEIEKAMKFYSIRIAHQDGDNQKIKKLEKYIQDTMSNPKDMRFAPYIEKYNNDKFYAVSCMNLYESRAYMQEIDMILRPYYLQDMFPKQYQKQYKETINLFLQHSNFLDSKILR
ncbi:hypothetical protein [Helicobacter sp. T3_23-1059]